MLKELKSKISIVNKKIILILFLIALIYFVIYCITAMSSYNKNNNAVVSKNTDYSDISSYINDDNIVKDYNLYSSLNDATKNFLYYLQDKKYDLTYTVMDKEIKRKYKKEEYISKISDYYKKLFDSNEDIDMPIAINDIVIAYKVDNSNYLCSYNDQNGNLYYIGIRLYNNNKYKIFYINI